MKHNINELKSIANEIRKDIVKMVNAAGSGHPGGSLSAVEILTALYFNEMNIDPDQPKMKGRDRFVLSKGHAAPVVYSTLARRGYFNPSELMNLRKIGHMLQGHPNMDSVPGVDMSTGSLGQGFSTSVGMALASKLDKTSERTFVLLGDGELNEGIVWEAAMSASHYKLDNLTGFVDYNGLQIDGPNEEVMGIKPLDMKWESFGWHVIMADGHDFDEIFKAIEEAKTVKEKPSVIIANTVKGKGVSFMENQASWHGSAPNDELLEVALKDLGGTEHE